MNLKTRVVTLLVALLGVIMLTACEEKPVQLPFPDTPPTANAEKSLASGPMKRDSSGKYHIAPPKEHGAKVIPTTPLHRLEHGVRKVSRSVQYGMAWILLAAGILLPGPLLIFLIPGLLTGRAEKVLEGALIFAVGVFMAGLVKDTGVSTLAIWVWICLLGPGVLLFLWGLVSSNEAGKFLLVAGPTLVFALFVLGQGFRMLVMGVIGSGIFTFVLLAIFVATLVGAVGRISDSEPAPA